MTKFRERPQQVSEQSRRKKKMKKRLKENSIEKPLQAVPALSLQLSPVATKSQQKRKRRSKHRKAKPSEDNADSVLKDARLSLKEDKKTSHSEAHKNNKESSKQGSLLDKMRERLSGSYFRMLNERLYTCSGQEAFDFFRNNPSLFDVYHTGYQKQMSQWPQQPVNVIIKWLKDRKPSLVVADFGCGDAKLAKSVPNKVFSMDLVSCDPSIISCDMAHTPLRSSSVDVAVFCLSLMGTDFPEYLKEAYRVLRPNGWLLIAEVKSRFDPNNGGADPDKFIESLHHLGFKSISQDFSNKMFLLFYFRKDHTHEGSQIDWPKLKPCIYKRR